MFWASLPEHMPKMLTRRGAAAGVLAERNLPKVHGIKRRLGSAICDEITERYEAGQHDTALAKQLAIAALPVLVVLRARGVIMYAEVPSPGPIAKLVVG